LSLLLYGVAVHGYLSLQHLTIFRFLFFTYAFAAGEATSPGTATAQEQKSWPLIFV
jgi:hypothetical protein